MLLLFLKMLFFHPLIQAQQKSIIIQKYTPDALPDILADTEKTSWVLINFLTNAVKYSTESSTIEIAVYQKNDMVEFSVTDNGRGIEEKYLPKIFAIARFVVGISQKFIQLRARQHRRQAIALVAILHDGGQRCLSKREKRPTSLGQPYASAHALKQRRSQLLLD